MNSPDSLNNDFLNKLNSAIEAHFKDHKFGASALAHEMGMSRSNLHRKVFSHTKLSVSQFIRNTRLKKAKELLRHTSDTVSEVAYNVGFNNVSYFIKCFHEYYGYSPGEVGNRNNYNTGSFHHIKDKKKRKKTIIASIVLTIALATTLLIVFKPFKELETTVVVLPARFEVQDTKDSTIINGILYEVIQNLFLEEDIETVVPWHNVLQYQNTYKPASIIAKELQVSYVIKPTFRIIDGNTYLSFTLIEGLIDKPLYTFNEEIDLIQVALSNSKISKIIADNISSFILVRNTRNKNNKLSGNTQATNLYLQTKDTIDYLKGTRRLREQNLVNAIDSLEKAVQIDDHFVLAYAQLANYYFFLDYFQEYKTFRKEIFKNAEYAMKYGEQNGMAYLARALYSLHIDSIDMATLNMQRAIQLNPDTYLALINISYINSLFTSPSLEQHLKYGLWFTKLNVSEYDTTEMIRNYSRFASTLRSSGFFEESEKFYNKALQLSPKNPDLIASKGLLYQDWGKDIQEQIAVVLPQFKRDSINYSVLRTLFLIHFENRDYNKAFEFFNIRTRNGLYHHDDDVKVGIIHLKLNQPKKANNFFNSYLTHAENYSSDTKDYRLSAAYACLGDTTNTIKHMKLYAQNKYATYWTISHYETSPIFDNVRSMPEFTRILNEMKTKFWNNHAYIKRSLMEKGLI